MSSTDIVGRASRPYGQDFGIWKAGSYIARCAICWECYDPEEGHMCNPIHFTHLAHLAQKLLSGLSSIISGGDELPITAPAFAATLEGLDFPLILSFLPKSIKSWTSREYTMQQRCVSWTG